MELFDLAITIRAEGLRPGDVIPLNDNDMEVESVACSLVDDTIIVSAFGEELDREFFRKVKLSVFRPSAFALTRGMK